MDYIRQFIDITFGPDEDEKSIQVPIIRDSLRERSETFYGRFFVGLPYTRCQQLDTATIEILYNDCKQPYLMYSLLLATHYYLVEWSEINLNPANLDFLFFV